MGGVGEAGLMSCVGDRRPIGQMLGGPHEPEPLRVGAQWNADFGREHVRQPAGRHADRVGEFIDVQRTVVDQLGNSQERLVDRGMPPPSQRRRNVRKAREGEGAADGLLCA